MGTAVPLCLIFERLQIRRSSYLYAADGTRHHSGLRATDTFLIRPYLIALTETCWSLAQVFGGRRMNMAWENRAAGKAPTSPRVADVAASTATVAPAACCTAEGSVCQVYAASVTFAISQIQPVQPELCSTFLYAVSSFRLQKGDPSASAPISLPCDFVQSSQGTTSSCKVQEWQRLLQV